MNKACMRGPWFIVSEFQIYAIHSDLSPPLVSLSKKKPAWGNRPVRRRFGRCERGRERERERENVKKQEEAGRVCVGDGLKRDGAGGRREREEREGGEPPSRLLLFDEFNLPPRRISVSTGCVSVCKDA